MVTASASPGVCSWATTRRTLVAVTIMVGAPPVR
jgi:hypothetical protein